MAKRPTPTTTRRHAPDPRDPRDAGPRDPDPHDAGLPAPAPARADVPAAFDRAAAAYDRLVAANPGYHAQLRRSARRLRLPGDGAGLHLLDLGCGTGASTAALLAAAPRARITAVDASAGMLARARAKPWPARVRFVRAHAEELRAAGVTGPFDGALAAYLVRNLPDPDATLCALRELLAPGAPLAVHEYALGSPRARAVWHLVCWSVIVPAGRLLGGDAGLYRYLWRSVREFDTPAQLCARLERCGFQPARALPMPGWQRGIAHTFLTRRPAEPGHGVAPATEAA
ncbi:class I SAM-dependent methyltransferase [Allostreptomyces psammosilenae]|uniref:Ubiquinone/menaquinone biosynthesis C-methylase UbiE n=1 Tax=Allostreptomyces psammosilenae TaxID=1892865 RepID=A0A852ZQQ9_9ACTN|nr:class I SAM-dependent methyltransferase [Allostreptomyces psammosilenae]NYI03620.1 ubiquinone/menaquinone biosynthesis C-methylase UbiE [Allostreptomyces psammosilenae]